MKLVEVEGSHTLQNTYAALDIHLGQTYSVLVTMDQAPQDYYIVVSSRFTPRVLTTTAILHYSNSRRGVSGPIPGGPTTEIAWSLNQARSIRYSFTYKSYLPYYTYNSCSFSSKKYLQWSHASWNLTASGPRPNPQGSYHYGMIKISRTITLANSAPYMNGKQRCAINSVSFVPADTPLKLADYFKIPGVFTLGSMPTSPNWGNAYLQTSVMAANFREFVEIVFQNWEDTVQSYHIDGYSFFVVGWAYQILVLDILDCITHNILCSFLKNSLIICEMIRMDGGQWTPASRTRYNLRDTVARSTTQVRQKKDAYDAHSVEAQ